MNRHLTPAEKTRELARWAEICSTSPSSGPGTPDPEIVPWCERINELDGICTLQSCAGHLDGEHGHEGHIWLWLDRDRLNELQDRGIELADRNGIERVSVIYQPWGQEIVEVCFKGVPADRLDSSMGVVLGFLESL